MIFQVLLNGVAEGALLALIGLGISLTYLVGRFFHFAHGALIVVGAFVTLSGVSIGVPLAAAAAAGILLATCLAVLMDIGIYGVLRARRAGPGALLVASMGAFALLEGMIGFVWGAEERVGGFGLYSRYEIAVGVGLTSLQWVQVVSAGLAYFVLCSVLRRTERGLRWRACSEEPDLALVFGINVDSETRVVLAVGTAVGVLGALFRGLETSFHPAMGFGLLMGGVLAAVVGGLGRPVSALWGGLLIGILRQLVGVYASSRLQDAVVFGFLIVLLLLRPQGLWGERVKARAA